MDSCSNCPKRDTCRAICDVVESKLPKMWDGRDWPFTEADAKQRVERLLRNRISVRIMLDNRDCLTDAQRQVFDLYYNEGLSQQAIAERLGVRRNTVDEHLMRARKRIVRATDGDSAPR